MRRVGVNRGGGETPFRDMVELMGVELGSCDAFFEGVVSTSVGDLKVYRCDWGWYVKSGHRDVRSRYLDDAFERLLGAPLDRKSLQALVEMLDRELTAERDRTGRTASVELHAPTA